MNTILEVDDLAVRYGGVRALDGVSVRLSDGEIRGLIGPNGSGKSTFIDAISGRKLPASGRIRLFGQEVTRLSAVDRRLRGLSRSFQRTSIFPELTVREQMSLAARRFGSDPGEILEALGLAAHLESLANQLGYGEQRRLDLALALVGSPKLLLLDEPAAGLSRESLALADMLRALVRDAGTTVCLVEHDMDVIFGISDSVTVFDTGRVIAEGEPKAVRSDPAVRRAYLGSEG
ncbi:ABC transporter ATP-binding protein [Chelatococcus asaccharovorans]|uniref:ABC transporter ATP-binding protein n=1 Tax=Chelatococcus asaccharovorans TaxID=28210 RepID=UPI00224C7527|nr:ABC transporter ATP-binding protein [Chelatococcus asaccharovorans]CAH1659708.1 Amino acid/amide ABC transporter ATP-binding protein 1 (HAAT family) [Chelatococcus asaccharovorans]CAH1684093.1 Amino acid/amide ABC transporter ATP-binding protein 1 (HAAT family) [Chelatococcus asaccharovorans]